MLSKQASRRSWLNSKRHAFRATLITIHCCDWAQTHGVVFHDVQGRLIDDWTRYGGGLTGFQVYFRERRVDVGFCFIANTEGLRSMLCDDAKRHHLHQPAAADRRIGIPARRDSIELGGLLQEDFSPEENMMRTLHYPDLKKHIEEHQQLHCDVHHLVQTSLINLRAACRVRRSRLLTNG